MPRYEVDMTRATADTALAVGVLEAASSNPRRMWLYDIMIGSPATPADNNFEWTIDRVTAIGSQAGGSGVTPSPLDPADLPATSTATQAVTTNPTLGVRLLRLPLNQRGTFRWVAAPGGELLSPSTAQNGFAVRTPTSSAVAVSATLHYIE